MSYVPGVHWHVTYLDGKTITWISDGDEPIPCGVVSVVDPESDRPAHRVLGNGTSEPLTGETAGLTVYGTYHGNRPTLDEFRELAKEYAYLADGLAEGRGVTHNNVTDQDRPTQ